MDKLRIAHLQGTDGPGLSRLRQDTPCHYGSHAGPDGDVFTVSVSLTDNSSEPRWAVSLAEPRGNQEIINGHGSTLKEKKLKVKK